jgi:hypothetical protein
MEAQPPIPANPKIQRVEVYWHTLKYRTVVLYALVVLAIFLASGYLFFPETFAGAVQLISEPLHRQGPNAGTAKWRTLNWRQARFVNLDGKVKVQKVHSEKWESADYQMTLNKGDLVQTGSDGVARIVFADGTTYTVKPNSLVSVEEQSITAP